MQNRHAARPVSAATVAPECPGDLGQFRMTGHVPEIEERLLERGARAVPGIAPHLAVCLLRLLVGRRHQRAVVLFRQCLPMQVPRTGKAGFAGTFPASVLVDDKAAQGFHSRRNPDGVFDGKNQLTGFVGRFVADAVVRRLRFGIHIVGRFLSKKRSRGKEKTEKIFHESNAES